MCDPRTASVDISIHAPHTRSDFLFSKTFPCYQEFQSTPLIRGATRKMSHLLSLLYFNPRPSYEERRRSCPPARQTYYFNPRPSYEERRGGHQ